jgi:hypothetical protein
LNYWTPGRVLKDWIESDIAEKEFIIEIYNLDHPKPLIRNHLVETDWLYIVDEKGTPSIEV